MAVDDIPDSGMHVEIDAPAEIRAQVLAVVEGLSTVREILKLSGVFDLHRRGARVHVTGHVRAKVGQTCVVTLEPIDSDIDETVDLMFAPTTPKRRGRARKSMRRWMATAGAPDRRHGGSRRPAPNPGAESTSSTEKDVNRACHHRREGRNLCRPEALKARRQS